MVTRPPPVTVREAAELDEARLVGMQRQPESRESLPQFDEEAVGFLAMLEAHEVIGKPRHDHVAARLRPTPSLDPEVEHVVKTDVGQQRTDTSALNRAHLTRRTGLARNAPRFTRAARSRRLTSRASP